MKFSLTPLKCPKIAILSQILVLVDISKPIIRNKIRIWKLVIRNKIWISKMVTGTKLESENWLPEIHDICKIYLILNNLKEIYRHNKQNRHIITKWDKLTKPNFLNSIENKKQLAIMLNDSFVSQMTNNR